MVNREHMTLVMGAPDSEGRRWKKISSDPQKPTGQQVGFAEKPCLVGRLHQGTRLLESAVREMDQEGWELVSHSFSGLIFAFYGVAVFRREKN